MFFDFGAAFDSEIENFSLEEFMRSGEDPGYVGNWRLLKLNQERLGRWRLGRCHPLDRPLLRQAVYRVTRQAAAEFPHKGSSPVTILVPTERVELRGW